MVVAAYDQVVEPIYEGPAAGFGAEALGRLRQRLALGASDLGAALAWAKVHAKARGLSRVVLVTDGVPTAGETSGEKLRALTVGLKEAGVERLDAIAVGGIRDDDLLRSLANAGLPHGGMVIDGAAPPQETWRRLWEATRSGLEVQVEGAQFVYPRRVDGVQAGDEVVVYARVPEGQAVRITVGDGPAVAPEAMRAERPLLERAWVGARIKSLIEEERQGGPAEKIAQEIVGLSTRFRVLSPRTALLVLESDGDYARFGIDRRALADILVADGGRVGLMTRSAPQLVAKGTPPVVPSSDTDLVPRHEAARLRDPGPPPAEKPEAPAQRKAGPERDDPSPTVNTAPPGAPPPPPPPPPEAADHILAPMPAAAPAPMMAAESAPSRSRSPLAALRSLFSRSSAAPADAPAPAAAMAATEPPRKSPYTGPFATVMEQLAQRRIEPAVEAAFTWRKSAPGDVMALVALGEAFEAAGDFTQAARCYGSIIDLFPARADLRRFAGERLERLPASAGLDLAVDTFAKAEEQRPDHPASHRLYAYALLRRWPAGEGFRGHRPRAAPALPGGPLRRRAAHPGGGRRPHRRGLGQGGAGARRRDPAPRPRRGRERRGRAVDPLRAQLGDGRQRRRLPHPRRGGRPRLLQPEACSPPAAISTPTSPRATAPSASPSAPDPTSAGGRTGCRRTTTRAARWATAWASWRSSSTTARAG